MSAGDDNRAARLRAMWAYSGVDQKEFIANVGNGASANHLRRNNPAEPTDGMLISAADFVKWSHEFARRGPGAIEREPASDLRDEVRRQADELLELREVVEALLRRAQGGGADESGGTPDSGGLR